jgi:hypothetical protein
MNYSVAFIRVLKGFNQIHVKIDMFSASSSMRSYPFPHQRYQQPLIRERQLLVEQAVEEDWPNNHNIAHASSSSPSGMHYNKEQSRVVHLYGPSRPNSQQLQLQPLPVDHEPLLQQQQQPINWPSSHYQHHQHHHHHITTNSSSIRRKY